MTIGDQLPITLGSNVTIQRGARLVEKPGAPITIGDNVKILRGSEVLGPVTIGNNVFINRDGYIRPNVRLGNGVNLGPFVRLISDTHDIGPAEKRAGRSRFDPIVVGDGTWIGASVTVVGGVTIGAGCVIAAGAVVVSDIPDNSLAVGIPAKVVRQLP